MTDSLTLFGATNYNTKFPPRNAKRGYVAKLTGRAPGAVKYAREFLGERVTLVAGDDGLYEVQTGQKKGGYDRDYCVVLTHAEHGLVKGLCDEADVAKITQRLDQGYALSEIVEVGELRESRKTEGLLVFSVAVRTVAAAKQAFKCATLESAIESCWQTLALLPLPEQKKVLAELRKRVTPPAAQPAAPAADVAEEGRAAP